MASTIILKIAFSVSAWGALLTLTETQRLKKTHERQWTLTPDLDFSNDQHVPIISESKKTSVRVAAETSNRSPAKTTSTQNKNRKKDNMAKVLSEILPHDLHGGIANQRSICVAYLVKDPGRRCGDKVKDSQEFGQSLSVLKEHHGRKDYTALLIQTKILLPKFLCKRHYNCAQRRYGFVESLIQHHCVVEEASKDDPYGFISDPSYSRLCWTQFLSWIDIVCQQVTNNQGPVPETLEIKTSVKTASSITVTSQKPAKLKAASSKKDQTNSFTEPRVSWLTCFTVWQPTWSKYLSVSQALEKQAQRPLLKTEIPPGYIYMYWVKGNFGLAKIGYSTDIDRRLREWRKQCKQDCQLQKSAGPGQCLRVLVPHARRLENLIHAELKELRGKMFCKVCGTNHREWFEVSEGHAVAVYLKWKDWIMQSPYERVEDGLWKLKEDVADSLEEVCRPLEHVDNDMLRKKSVQKRKEVRVSQYWKPKTRLRKWKT
ncbi:unnamed protein product [Periconia digitata]|uniref:Bacteriophage T5 Orf172 DNA-binding domain-containing protein n=1 Tax=Periconia digitata TaxID=1303443 RepID=A0A9W4XVJ2_9PLEO|nr:unnamed protein product [Periconia digitata]